jgi:hypothetical protein
MDTVFIRRVSRRGAAIFGFWFQLFALGVLRVSFVIQGVGPPHQTN